MEHAWWNEEKKQRHVSNYNNDVTLQMKYWGAKNRQGRRIAAAILALVPRAAVKSYLEPFCGVAGVLVHVRELLPDRVPVAGSDCSRCIINFLQAIMRGWLPPEALTEELFNRLKATKGDETPMHAVVGFGCCFNGLYFADKFRPNMLETYVATRKQVARWAPRVRNISFENVRYEDRPRPPDGCLVYCDCPYQGAVSTNMPQSWKDFDFAAFWDWVRDLSRTHIVLVSEYVAPDDFVSVWQHNVTLLNRSRKSGRTEHLFAHHSVVPRLLVSR